MSAFSIVLSPLLVAPTVLFICTAIVSVIGNILKAMTYTNTAAGIEAVWLTLWQAYYCSTSGSCVLYTHADLDKLTGAGSGCDSFVAHFRAAEAFGVITSVLSGAAVLVSILFVVYQYKFGFRGVSRAGLFGSSFLAAVELIQFVIFITLKDRTCITALAQPSPELGPAPFMYLGGTAFALMCAGCYLRIGRVYKDHPIPSPPMDTSSWSVKHKTTPTPSRIASTIVNVPQESQREIVAATEAPQSVSSRMTTFVQQQQPVLVGQSSFQVSQQQRQYQTTLSPRPSTVSPIRVRSPVRAPSPTAEGVWPDGDDWQVDEPSGLLWSESKHLFFDRNSGQFYDPRSDQWYDPDADRWYKITK